MEHWFISDQGSVRSGWKASGFFLLLLALTTAAGTARQFLPALSPWLGAGLGALASLLCVKLEHRSFRSLGFSPGRRWVFECLAGLLGGTLIILATALLVRGLGGFHWERAAGIGTRQLLASAWFLLGVAFNEEILARGYPFQRLVEGAGPWASQLVLATLFVLLHWNNPGMHGSTRAWASLNIGLAAILLGLCYLRTRSLAMPIGLHLGWNWAQGGLLGFGVSGTTNIKGLWTPVFHGRPEWLTGGAFGLEASLPCALMCGVAILAVWHWKGSGPPADASGSE
jgi:hypothetical protein